MFRYQEWIENFSPSTQHLVLNDANTCMGSVAVHRIQYQLNLLSSEIFPLLSDRGTATSIEKHCVKKQKLDDDAKQHETEQMIDGLSVNSRPGSPDSNLIQPGTLCKFHLRPKKGLDR